MGYQHSYRDIKDIVNRIIKCLDIIKKYKIDVSQLTTDDTLDFMNSCEDYNRFAIVKNFVSKYSPNKFRNNIKNNKQLLHDLIPRIDALSVLTQTDITGLKKSSILLF
jgi:hypothetical protein